MSGKTTRDLFATVYADSAAEPEQMAQLQAHIDQVQGEVLEEQGSDGVVAATCKSFDVTRVLLQQGLLSMRHLGRDTTDQAQLMSVVAANVAFFQAAVQAFPAEQPE